MKAEYSNGLIILTNDSGASVTFEADSAKVVAISVPDRHGRLANVVRPTFEPNNPETHNPTKWTHRIVSDCEVEFTAHPQEQSASVHDEKSDDDAHRQPMPSVSISYRWTVDNTIEQYITANHYDKSFVMAPFLNLDDPGSPSILDHYLWLNASRYSAQSPDGVTKPTAKTVANTIYDFTKATQLRNRSSEVQKLQSAEYLLSDWEPGVMDEAAVLASHATGRQLTIYTTLPALTIHLNPSVHHSTAQSALSILPQSPYEESTVPEAAQPTTHLLFYEFTTF